MLNKTMFLEIDSIKKIEDEAADAQLQYDAISANWDHMLSIKDPLDIDAEMKEQKKKCDRLLAQKDQLIGELKSDLKRMDEAYYEDLEKQVMCICYYPLKQPGSYIGKRLLVA